MPSKFLKGKKILPDSIDSKTSLTSIVDNAFTSYNAGRLREACQLLKTKVLEENVTVGLSLSGAMTPAGYGMSCIIPLMKNGFIDWIVSTGANLYHDAHYGLNMSLYHGTPFVDDRALRKENVIRIYDIFFDAKVLYDTDKFFREIIKKGAEFQKEMGTAEFHHYCGKYLSEIGKKNGTEDRCLLAAAYKYGVPVYTSSPGDSSIGMNVAAVNFRGKTKLKINPMIDVNETASIVLNAKKHGGKSAVILLGGGSPKNFVLQTEPQIQEVFGISEKGHDYFIQVTDARPDTGGLSGATPAEAVSWGKVDPDKLPDTVVVYTDSTIALPILTSYSLASRKPRPLKRLYDKRQQMLDFLKAEDKKVNANEWK